MTKPATTRPRRRRTKQQLASDGQLTGYVEILPGFWQPVSMAEAERWKRAQLKRGPR